MIDEEVRAYLMHVSANCFHAANSNDQAVMDSVLANIRETIDSYLNRE